LLLRVPRLEQPLELPGETIRGLRITHSRRFSEYEHSHGSRWFLSGERQRLRGARRFWRKKPPAEPRIISYNRFPILFLFEKKGRWITPTRQPQRCLGAC